MKTKRRLRPIEIAMLVVPLCALAFASWHLFFPIVPPRLYSVTDLGSLGDTGNPDIHLNNEGDVVGYWRLSGKVHRPFLWRRGKVRLLGNRNGTASSINDKGLITINLHPKNYAIHACLWRNGKLISLSNYYSAALDINERGEIIGTTQRIGKNKQIEDSSFIWNTGYLRDLAPHDDNYTEAHSINNAGIVVGKYIDWNRRPDNKVAQNAFLWRRGAMKTMSWRCSAIAINNKNAILGTFDNRPAIWKNYRWTTLKIANDPNSFSVSAFNDAEQVVGNAIKSKTIFSGFDRTIQQTPFPFIYEEEQLYDLNDCIQEKTQWKLLRVTDINNRGQIVGEGTLNGKRRFFLLTPQDPATSSTRTDE